MKIAVCDDNQAMLHLEEKSIKSVRPMDEVICYNRPADLMSAIETTKPDVVFWDIELNEEKNGIDYAVKLNSIRPQTQVVFVSQYDRYAVKAHMADHCYYVLKDELKERLADVFERIEKKLNASSQVEKGVYITTLHSKEKTFVKYRDIVYISTSQRHIEIHTKTANLVANHKMDSFLKEVEDSLLVRCHQSFAINLANIENYSRESLLMNDGAYIPISRKYISSVRDAFVRYAENELI